MSDVSCGSTHTGALTKDGAAFAWGSGTHGQLGIGVIDHAQKRPAQITKLKMLKCRQIACGGLHTSVLTNDGRVVAFGWGRQGQIGQRNAVLHESPMFVALPEIVVQLASGGNHSLALSATGRCYAWGAGAHGQVGSPTRQNRRLPRLVVLETLDAIKADGRTAGSTDAAAAEETTDGGMF